MNMNMNTKTKHPDISFEYHMRFRDGDVKHSWICRGNSGAVEIWASPLPSEYTVGDRTMYGGCEFHSRKPNEYSTIEPSHDFCDLTRGECWHDGSSMYFAENVMHLLPPDLLNIPDETTRTLLSLVRYEYGRYFNVPMYATIRA